MFLVPEGNCREAKGDKPDGLELVKVSTLDDAPGRAEETGEAPNSAVLNRAGREPQR